MTTPTPIRVRAAHADDRDAIVAFCQNTFSWGDYIAEVWERWLTDARGQLLVGVVGEQPVSVMHVAVCGETAWLEGMRVHPAFRRQGIARLVEAEGRAWARARGCRVARLATSIKNVAAQTMLGISGYRRVAQFNEWESEPTSDDFSHAPIATETDRARVSALWDASEACAASRAIVPDREWHWTPLDETRWRAHLRAGEVRLAPHGLALVVAFDEREWSSITLHALAGDEETMRALARAARSEAAYRGYPHLAAQIADCPSANRALEGAGFERGGGMFIYELEL